MGIIPFNISNSLNAYRYSVFQIEEFCGDDASDPDSLHNPLAPNVMNKLCNYSSAWSVMRNHTDFQTDVPPVSIHHSCI